MMFQRKGAMKACSTSIVISLCTALGLAGGAVAQQDQQAPRDDARPSAAAPVEYKPPPARGRPAVTVGGGTRSMPRELFLAAIAPRHVGLASSEQPELFWYVSQPVASPLAFTLEPVDGSAPAIEKVLPAVSSGGIQRIRLADLGLKLNVDQDYRWAVSLGPDAASKANVAVASGFVRVQPLPEQVRTGGGAHATYAQAGYWYDAMASLRTSLAATPTEAELLADQESLLRQVGLGEVARREAEREGK